MASDAPAPTVPALPVDDAALLARAGVRDRAGRGLFEDDAWIRRVSREQVLLFGGGRALLLEIAHPLVAAGVARHSEFRTDPFGRLRRTLDAMSAITFGDTETALAAARSVERAHARVHGTLGAPTLRLAADTPYHGRQPDLMQWVWATLVDTAVVVYRLFVAELDAEAIESYYAQQRTLAAVLGVPLDQLPADWTAFRADFDEVLESGRLEVTSEAREVAEAVLNGAGPGPARSITAALLPPSLRDAFGLPWDEARALRFRRLVDSVRQVRAGRAVDAAGETG